jgi:hypothetical protein
MTYDCGWLWLQRNLFPQKVVSSSNDSYKVQFTFCDVWCKNARDDKGGSGRPEAWIMKVITAVFYGFRNKLERLSLNTRLGWKGLPGTNILAYYGNRNTFYDIGTCTIKQFKFIIYMKWTDFVVI